MRISALQTKINATNICIKNFRLGRILAKSSKRPNKNNKQIVVAGFGEAAADEEARSLLMMRPVVAMLPERRYVVGIRGLVDAQGALVDAPELANDNPYDDGWFFKVKLADEPESLLDASQYASEIGEA